MKSRLRALWWWVRWPLALLSLAYVGLVLYRVWAIGEEEKTQQAVVRIHAQKITLADVMGDNLPPMPNKQENDATIEGVDVNNNGIRDDVELAIFEKYPNSARIRAAQLQYALTEQMFLTRVFNTETWKAVAEEDSRASFCVSLIHPRADLKEFSKVIDQRIQEVEGLVFNTESRRQKKEKVFDFITSYGLVNTSACDVALDMLSS